MIAVTGLAFFLFAYGLLGKGYAVTAVVHDLAPYLVIVSATVLGSLPRVWQDTDRLVLGLFLVGLVVNAVGMTEMTTVVSESYAEDRAGITTVAYRTQGALAFWPLLLLTARLRRPRIALLIFAGVFFVLAQQILFQKRAPTLRIAAVHAGVPARASAGCGRADARGRPAPRAPRARRLRWPWAPCAVVGARRGPLALPGQLAGLVARISGGHTAAGRRGC